MAMNIRMVIFVIGGLLFGGIIAVLLYYVSTQDTRISVEEQELTVVPSPTPSPVPVQTYESESGFMFEYPGTVEVHEEEGDTASYANLKLTSPEASGSISLQVSDTRLRSAQAWFTQQKIDSEDAEEIPFADIEALQVATPGGLVTASYDQGALFVIRTDWYDHEPFWQDVYNLLVSTFEFAMVEEEAPAPATSGGGASSGDIIFEGEEIIE